MVFVTFYRQDCRVGANCRYCFYSQSKNQVLRPAGATRCTDSKFKFCTAKRTQVPVGPEKFDLHRCNESPLRDETPDFWPCVNLIRRCLTLRGNAAGNKHHIFAPTASACCAIFSKICTVTELVVPIKKSHLFFDPMHSFSYRLHGKIRPN